MIVNILGTVVVFCSSSWFTTWVGLEMSSMSIPALIVFFDSSLVSKINSWKYYMVQCYSSSIFILSVVCLSMSSFEWMYSNLLWIMVIFSMLLKMGILPFHGWFFHVSMSMPWIVFLIVSSIQKIGPLVVIGECFSNFGDSMKLDLMIGCLITVMSLPMLSVKLVRYFFIVSSIINTAWIIICLQVSKYSFVFFMLMYFLHLFMLFFVFKKEYSMSLESVFFIFKKNFMEEFVKMLLVSSLIGIPPLVGFFMKVFVLEQMILSDQFFSSLVMLVSSSVISLMYIKIVISFIFNMRLEMFQFKLTPELIISLVFIFIGSFLFFI